jgi:hypothetical protein
VTVRSSLSRWGRGRNHVQARRESKFEIRMVRFD